MVERTLRSFTAVYTLGKLNSKYLMLDLLGFAGDRLFVKTLLFTSSHNMRSLLIKNYKILEYCVEN